MTVINVELRKHPNKTNAKGNSNAFFEWCDRVGLGKEGYDISVMSDETFKGHNIEYFVVNYGQFETLDGWLLFITYRGDILNVVRYHTWKWDGRQAVIASHKLDKFANI